MRRELLWVAACLWAAAAAVGAAGQGAGQSAATCACGAHPPGPPKDRVVEPYAGEPDDMSPYVKF